MRKWSRRNLTPAGPIFPVRSACLVSHRRRKAVRPGRRRFQHVPGNLCNWPSCRATLSHNGRLATSRPASRRASPFRGRAIVTDRQRDDTMHFGVHAAHNFAKLRKTCRPKLSRKAELADVGS